MVISDRRARKKARTRQQIIKLGIALFSKHGMDAVTIDQIADAADIGKGTIYNYFHSKEDIVVAFMAGIEQKVQATLRGFDPRDRPLADVLMAFVREHFRMKQRHHRFVRVFFAQMFLHSDQFLPYMAEIHALVTPNLQALFEDLQRRGAVRADVSVADLALVFGHLQFGLSALWAIEGPPFQGTEVVMQREITLFCEGVTART